MVLYGTAVLCSEAVQQSTLHRSLGTVGSTVTVLHIYINTLIPRKKKMSHRSLQLVVEMLEPLLLRSGLTPVGCCLPAVLFLLRLLTGGQQRQQEKRGRMATSPGLRPERRTKGSNICTSKLERKMGEPVCFVEAGCF